MVIVIILYIGPQSFKTYSDKICLFFPIYNKICATFSSTDINEYEYAIDGSLCEYKCRNYSGHYKCICPDGSYQNGSTCAQSDQFDGKFTHLDKTFPN